MLDISPSAAIPATRRLPRASILAEVPAVVGLAFPVVAGLIGSTVLGVIDSFMLGPLGEVELAAASITQSCLVIFYAGLYGLVGSIGVFVAQGYGAGEQWRASRVFRHGLIIGLAGGCLGSLAMAGLLFVLPYTGQPPEVLAILPPYWIAMSALLVPFTLTMVIKVFLDSIGRPWTGAILTLVPIVINVPLSWLLIYGNHGFPKLGLLGAGFASMLAFLGGFISMILYLVSAPSMAPYRDAVKLRAADFSELLREGYPMAIQYLAEGSAVAIAGILIGRLGATALAANQIVFSLGVLIYMAPLGMSGAVSIRIAQAYGGGATRRVRAIGLAGILVVTLWMSAFTAIMVMWGEPISRLFVSDNAVVAAATAMFVAVGMMQIFDGLQSVGLGALRGMLDNRWPTIVSLVSYWLIALPLSIYLGFVRGYGGPGIWAGFGMGLAVAGISLFCRFLSQTKKLAMSANLAKADANGFYYHKWPF